MTFITGNAYASHPGELNGRFEHGLRYTPEYKAFHNAKQRCTNPKNDRYKDWGGRGIKFLIPSVSVLVEAIGCKPTKDHSIDRIDNSGHYIVGNIKWSTKSEQRMNSRPSSAVPHRSMTGRFSTQETQV